MRINHNISALQTNAHMRKTGNALDKAMEKLASGYKINRASDDAAGMAISRKMKTQIALIKINHLFASVHSRIFCEKMNMGILSQKINEFTKHIGM